MNMAESRTLMTDGLRGVLRFDEPMHRHTSWRAGGAADRAYTPADAEDLAAFLARLPADEPLLFAGLGSNLLVRDDGFRGTVVFMHGALGRIEMGGAGLVFAEAGVASPKVARFASMHAFEGAEFLAGIPGTVGGALAMNAGCYGAETWERVAKVRVIDRRGAVRERTPDAYDIGYRHCTRRDASTGDEWFLGAWFRFVPGDGDAARARIKDFLSRRIATQPLGQPNAGSVFRNPPGDHAARLIQSCGLKGHRIGGAEVSTKHANFIVNTGAATAADIEQLIHLVRETVWRDCAVRLEPEVRIVGQSEEVQ
jgi:UDP-N-acetylmuramate dehydrogenase